MPHNVASDAGSLALSKSIICENNCRQSEISEQSVSEKYKDNRFHDLPIHEDIRSMLRQIVDADETIELLIRASTGLGATLMGIKQLAMGVAVCTNKRIVFVAANGGLCIPLDSIISVSSRVGVVLGEVMIDCVHGQRYDFKDVSPKRDAQKFATVVTQLSQSQDRPTSLTGREIYGYFSLLTGSGKSNAGPRVTQLPVTGADLDYVNARMRECNIRLGLKHERVALVDRLLQGEVIVSAIVCSFTRSIGPDSDVFQQLSSVGLAVVTDNRLCLLARNKAKDDVFAEIPFTSIASLALSESLTGSSVRIACAGGPSYKVDTTLEKRRTKEFVHAVEGQLQNVKPRNSTSDGRTVIANRESLPSDLYVAERFEELGVHGNYIKGEREMLARLLDPGEAVVFVIRGTYSENLGQYNRPFREETHIGCVVLTDKRVLFLDKGILGNEEIAEVPFARIESVKHSKGPAWGGLHVNCVGGSVYKIEMVSPKQAAEDFADLLRAELNAATTKPDPEPSSTATVASVADELMKLKGLLDSGAIDQSEFDVLKGALISKVR